VFRFETHRRWEKYRVINAIGKNIPEGSLREHFVKKIPLGNLFLEEHVQKSLSGEGFSKNPLRKNIFQEKFPLKECVRGVFFGR
jgi:hypothetical protein